MIQNYARIVDGTVVEIILVPSGQDYRMCMHPNIAAQCQPAPTGCIPGWVLFGGSLVDPTASLGYAQQQKTGVLVAAYAAASTAPVAYMGTTFQADNISPAPGIDSSQDVLNKAITVWTSVGATPTGFYWTDASNNKVAMTLAQLQGFGLTMAAQTWTAFQNLQTKKAAVAAATTVAAVNSIIW